MSNQDTTPEAELFSAVIAGDVHGVKKLLKQVSTPDCINHNGVTPLLLANQLHYHEIICLLIAAGASIKAQDFAGNTIDDYFDGKVGQSVQVLSTAEVVAILTASLNQEFTEHRTNEGSESKRL